MYGGGLTIPGLPPRPTPPPPAPAYVARVVTGRDRYCERCDVKWTVQTVDGEDQLCWSCGGETEEEE